MWKRERKEKERSSQPSPTTPSPSLLRGLPLLLFLAQANPRPSTSPSLFSPAWAAHGPAAGPAPGRAPSSFSLADARTPPVGALFPPESQLLLFLSFPPPLFPYPPAGRPSLAVDPPGRAVGPFPRARAGLVPCLGPSRSEAALEFGAEPQRNPREARGRLRG
jgi:hypothetical protein